MSSANDRYFETLDRPVKTRACDCPGCSETGDYRAPKNRALTDYYFFCLSHVRAYNAAWDYFAGMNGAEIEAHIRNATVWERPTWPMGEWKIREQQLHDAVMREFFSDKANEAPAAPPMPQVERDALAVLDIAPPVTFAAIKTQYRALVKRYHPDLHGGSAEASEKFKGINQAFAILRDIYEDGESA
ncbi:MAG: J domain-containing protein [Bdellovibrionales bacterium]